MTDRDTAAPWQPGTVLLHAGAPSLDGATAPVNPPVVRTSTVRFQDMRALADMKARRGQGENVSLYGRHGTDTHRALEAALCALEKARHAWLTPSGLAAISLGMLALVKPGDHVLVTDNVYDPVPHRVASTLLERFGVEVGYFDPHTQSLTSQVRANTVLVYAESPGSILYEVPDLPALARNAHARGLLLMADNTWATGCLMDAFELGVDVVASALTKYPSGHSDVMQGALLVRDDALAARIAPVHEALGHSVSADDAYLVLRGLRTLPVRLQQHGRHALAVAQAMEQHPAVRRVYCPALPSSPDHALWQRDFRGTNGLVTLQMHDFSLAQLNAFADALQLFSIGGSWGGYESLVLPVPAEALALHTRWTQEEHARQAAGEPASAGVVRLHIGLEDPQDLIADLTQALDRASAVR